MSFNPAIPAANDLLSQSQADLQTNFNQANVLFAINHVTFNDATVADRGKHIALLIKAGVAPVTGAGEGGLYVFNNAGARESLYYRRESAGAVIPISMIGGFACVSSAGALLGTAFNITSARTAQGRYTLTFTRAMLDANYVVVCTPDTAGGLVRVLSVITKAAGNFTVECQAGAGGFADPDTFSVIVFGELS